MSKPIHVQVLERAFELIRDEKNWCQGTSAMDRNGFPTVILSEDAVSFCSYGALIRAKFEVTGQKSSQTTPEPLLDYLDPVAYKEAHTGLITYNDSHTHAEIMALWEKALEKVC